MATNITLSAGVRSNLLNLQSTADLKILVQQRLSTGKKVNSALDNPSNFFTASALSGRASDLSNLLDGMANGIQTIQAANNGLTSITTTLQSMQSTLNQARQDKSFQSQSYDVSGFVAAGPVGTQQISFSGGAVPVGSAPVSVALTKDPGLPATRAVNTMATAATAGASGIDLSTAGNAINLTINGKALTITAAQLDLAGGTGGKGSAANLAIAINAAFAAAGGTGVSASVDGTNHLVFTSSTSGSAASVAITGVVETTTAGSTSGLANVTVAGADATTSGGPATAKTVDEMVSDINATAGLKGLITASNDNGKLRIQNISTQVLNMTGVDGSTGKLTGSATSTGTVSGNSVRTSLAKQFNDLRDQITKFGDDASFNGVNLLRADNLKLVLNESGTSFINVQAKDKNGQITSIDNAFLKTSEIKAQELDGDDNIDARLETVKEALSSIRSIASSFGSQLSSVQNRKDFTKQMINTLQVGSDNLTLADTNEEGANLLALNTRQQLQTTSLSFASQADQAVLQFLR
jgi:flagellin